MVHVHTTVVVETAWLFKNLKKLRTDTRTVNNSSGLRASSVGSSGLSSWANHLVSARRKRDQKKQTFGVHVILPLRLHFTPSMRIESCRYLLLFARTAKMSSMDRSRSAIVLSFCSGGRVCEPGRKVNSSDWQSVAEKPYIRFRTHRLRELFDVRRLHDLNLDIMDHTY